MASIVHALHTALEHHRAGRLADAEGLYRQVLAADPNNADAWHFLGVLAHQARKHETAADYIGRAIALRPEIAAFHSNLGEVYLAQGRLGDAEASYRRALAIVPQFADALYNLGNLLLAESRLEEALATYEQALRVRSGFAPLHNNLGIVLAGLGRYDQALVRFEESLRLAPDYASPHYNRALVRLTQGDYARGWADYEWGWDLANGRGRRRTFSQPDWKGELLGGRTILLWAEQGLGDTLQFVRFARHVKERGGRVMLECQRELSALLANSSEIDEVIVAGEALPHFDVHLPLASLGRVLNIRVDSIPARVPYVAVTDERREHWRKRLATLRGFKIGVAWQGRPEHSRDRQRSFSAEWFVDVGRIEGIQMISLQKGAGRDQLAVFDRAGVCVLDVADELSDMHETAALMQQLDLVICCDSAPAHLAGALGRAVWLPIPKVADWRWLTGREDSPWYSTMRLFRQTAAGDWASVFATITDELQRTVNPPDRIG